MKLEDGLLTDEIFEFKEFGTGKLFAWNASALQRAADAGKVRYEKVEFLLTPDLIEQVETRNGVEEHHLPTPSPERLEKPALAVLCPDDTHILVDGSHRLTLRARKGMTTAKAWAFSWEDAQPYMIENFNEKLSVLK